MPLLLKTESEHQLQVSSSSTKSEHRVRVPTLGAEFEPRLQAPTASANLGHGLSRTDFREQTSKPLNEPSSELPAMPDLSDPNSFVTTAPLPELRAFLGDMLAREAFREGEFVLSSGQRSSYYVNCKPVSLTTTGAVAIARLFLDQLGPETEAVAGLTLGADPLVSAASAISAYGAGRSLPALIVRKEAKGHGTRAFIEGPVLRAGARVTVLEDVVTTGKSALQAVERLQAAGYAVAEILAVVDRAQGGAELYRERGLEFRALFSLLEIRDRARSLSGSGSEPSSEPNPEPNPEPSSGQ